MRERENERERVRERDNEKVGREFVLMRQREREVRE